MTDPREAPAELDFYAKAEHWLIRGTEISDDPAAAHNCLLAGVGYALLAAVQMDRTHSAALNRSLTERENPPSTHATPMSAGLADPADKDHWRSHEGGGHCADRGVGDDR